LQIRRRKILAPADLPVEEQLPQTRLYVNNLPPRSTEQSVKTIFQGFGEIQEISMLNPRFDGTSVSDACFVCYYRQATAEVAHRALNSTMLSNSVLPLSIQITDNPNYNFATVPEHLLTEKERRKRKRKN